MAPRTRLEGNFGSNHTRSATKFSGGELPNALHALFIQFSVAPPLDFSSFGGILEEIGLLNGRQGLSTRNLPVSGRGGVTPSAVVKLAR